MVASQDQRIGPGNRQWARQAVMKALYQRDVSQGDARAALEYLAVEDSVPSVDLTLAQRLIDGILHLLPEIDRQIGAYARDWRLSRLAAVDRNILRVAFYEICHDGSVPLHVCASEAVDLANAFGGEQSPGFVNGVLGQLLRDLQPTDGRKAGS